MENPQMPMVPSIASNQNSITNTFLEQLEICIEESNSILRVLVIYDTNINYKNFDLDMEFELTKLNMKFIESTLSPFTSYKLEVLESHKIKMLKLFDFILYEFKRLRTKYEEINDFYFNMDEENRYISNIKIIMDEKELKPTKIGCLYIRLLNHYIRKLNKKLKQIKEKEFKIAKEEKEKFLFVNNKIHFLCKVCSNYLIEGEESMVKVLNNIQTNEMIKLVMSEINGLSVNSNDSIKCAVFVKKLIQNIYSKIKLEKSKTKKIIQSLKNGVSSFLSILKYNKGHISIDIMPISIIKMLFEAFETKIFFLQKEQEKTKWNEVIYLPKRNFENFKLISDKEGNKRSIKNLMKIRLITNQIIKINYNDQNLLENKKSDSKVKEINFFGLLLRVSKEFLTPSYNVILHIPGGGFFSQSSESHLNYLSQWANKTDSVIISMDYKLSIDNKYPLLLDECIKVYELIVKYSSKLFNFNINKLIIYSDSVGSLIAFDLIKHAIVNKLKEPDAAVFVFPYPNIVIDEVTFPKDPFEFFGLDDNLSNYLEMPLHLKLHDMFLDLKDDACYKEDHRLNFFLTDPLLVSKFPKTLIISSVNEPIQEDCRKLVHFLKLNNVDVTTKHLIYYCNGFLNIPSLFDSNYNKSLEYSLNFILKLLKPEIKMSLINLKERKKSDSSSGTTISSFINN